MKRSELPDRHYLKGVEIFLKEQLSLKDVKIIELIAHHDILQGVCYRFIFIFADNNQVNFDIKNIFDSKDFEDRFKEEFHNNKNVQRALKINKLFLHG